MVTLSGVNLFISKCQRTFDRLAVQTIGLLAYTPKLD